ncbi:hypothetical protein G6F61_002628 [Rhizopus arrhizus]|nr:hypothetical protein G6F61_002628 [Rhizopus arrhizus]
MRRRTTCSDYLDTNSPFLQNPHTLSSPQLYTSHHSLPPPPPPITSEKPAHTNTFVHKLYNMVIDPYFQHLISWSYSGSSFIVCNILEFSRDVLPKHFKHNNFSSFVRQLNMYGFHKVNKSSRGHRTLAENQIWEFSHARFIRNRVELLDDIKRKAMEGTDVSKRENNPIQSDMALMQASQSDLIQQVKNLQENFSHVMNEMQVMKQKQEQQAEIIKILSNYIQQNEGQEFKLDSFETSYRKQPPSIFVTSHDPQHSLLNDILQRSPLTEDISFSSSQTRPSIRFPLPPSPSPSILVSDDELDATSSLYSPNSPHTPGHSASLNSFSFSLDPLSHQ